MKPKDPSIGLAMGYGEKRCQACKLNRVDVIAEGGTVPNTEVCKPCAVDAIRKFVSGLPVTTVKPKDYVPIDQWAEESHPEFLKNIQVSVEMMTDLNPDDRYGLVRVIMQMTRQEFEKR